MDLCNVRDSADILRVPVYNKSPAIGTVVDCVDSCRDAAIESSRRDREMDTDSVTLLPSVTTIYRYTFTADVVNELYKFAKIHQYDERQDFKDAWELWAEEHRALIDDEARRLAELGYDGDVQDKMFKSARYYFRKKSTAKKEPVKRRVYVGTQKELLDAMDAHISSALSLKPSEGFDAFCHAHNDLIKEQITLLVRAGMTDVSEIKSKIKKTYKNRYFILSKL